MRAILWHKEQINNFILSQVSFKSISLFWRYSSGQWNNLFETLKLRAAVYILYISKNKVLLTQLMTRTAFSSSCVSKSLNIRVFEKKYFIFISAFNLALTLMLSLIISFYFHQSKSLGQNKQIIFKMELWNGIIYRFNLPK